jgi:3-hydroxyisobutyrate dehydrogenase
MGLLGSNFVRALIGKGEKVSVWNRTLLKAQRLEQYGAVAFADAAKVVEGATYVHLTLRDDKTVNEVLEKAWKGLRPGAIIIDHTTTSLDGAIRRTAEWKERGFEYVHAPVFMGPQNALESTGYMLVSGDQALIERLTPVLSRMTGKLLNFGPEVGRAAGMKLSGNCFLVTLTTGLRDTLLLAKGMGIPVGDLAILFDSWNPGALVPARLKRMTSGNYEQPSWELNMARKDVGLFLQEAVQGGVELDLIPVAANIMDAWIRKGDGGNDWTVIAKDAL